VLFVCFQSVIFDAALHVWLTMRHATGLVCSTGHAPELRAWLERQSGLSGDLPLLHQAAAG